MLPRLTTKSSDLLNIDALRFIAAAGVMVLHTVKYLDFDPRLDVAHLVDPLRQFVDMFFAISGFVIGYSYLDRVSTGDEMRKFWKGRFAYIYPIHLLTFLAFLAIGILGAGKTEFADNYDMRCIPANLVLGQAWGMCGHISFNFPSWSLSAEAMMYFLFPVFVMVGKRKAVLIPIAAAATMALLAAASMGTDQAWYGWTSPLGALRALPSFLFGLSLWLYRDRLRALRMAHTGMYVALASVLVSIALRGSFGLVLAELYAVVLFACACDLQHRQTRVARAVAPLGTLTLEIYMLHALVFVVLIAVVARRFLGLHGAAMTAAVLLSYVAVFVSAYAAKFLFVDPMKRLIMSLGGKSASRGALAEPA